jgi:tRNA-binding protein
VEPNIDYSDFRKIDMRVGRILSAEDFPEARKPAYKLEIDFGKEVGIKKSSAQLTKRYSKENLVNRKVIAVVNFLPKRVANFSSEVLVLGVDDGDGGIILLQTDSDADLGVRVY